MIIDMINACQGSGALPSGEIVAIEQVINKKFTPFSAYDGHPLEPNEVLTCNSPVFIMESENLGGVFTFAEDGTVCAHNRQVNTFTDSSIVSKADGTLWVKPTKYTGLQKLQDEFDKNNTGVVTPHLNKEETNMQNPMDILQQKVNVGAPAAPMNLQSSTPKEPRGKRKEEMAAEASQFQGKIQQMVSGVRSSVSDDVCSYNQKHGKLLGYVVGNGPKVVFSVAKYKPKTDATTPVAGGGNEYKITVRQSKPSRPKAVVFSIPENTFKSLEELSENRSDYTLSKLLEVSAPTMVTQVESTDIAHRIILLYFKGTIMESPEVWAAGGHAGEEGKVECGYKSKVSKKGNATPELHSYMKAYRESGISSQLVGWNYIPLKTYKTISVGSGINLSDTDLAKLNETVYQPLQNNGGSGDDKDNASTKFARLHPSSKNYFHANADGTMGVDFFKKDTAAFGLLMGVKHFWAPRNSDYILSSGSGVVPVAYKEYTRPADESKPPRFQYATISILEDEGEVIFNEYASFVNVVGKDIINVDTLKKFARRVASQRKETNVIKGLAAQKLALGELGGSLQNVAGLKLDAVEDLGSALDASQEAARASLLNKIS